MTRDPLQRLLRLRQRAVEQARLAVVAAVHGEAEAEAAIKLIDARAERDRQAAAELVDVDPYLGHVLGRGRTRFRAERTTAEASLVEAECLTASRRTQLTAARSEAEAVETLIANRKAEAAAVAERRTAHELDDIFRAQLLRRQRARGSQEG